MAWYNAGVRVLDYSGLADLSGVGVLDIWQFDPNTGDGGAAEDRGTWLTADELDTDAVSDLATRGQTLDSGYRPYCLIDR